MGQLRPTRIPNGSSIGLDTVTLIYFLEKHPRHFETAEKLFSKIEAGELSGTISTIAITELLVPAFRAKQIDLANKLTSILANFPNLSIQPVTLEISQKAAELRAAHGLRTPDAIHVSSALLNNADIFVTNDLRLSILEKAQLLKVLLFGTGS